MANTLKKFDFQEVRLPSDMIRDFLSIERYEQNIAKWCMENINLENDVSSACNSLDFRKYPYQIEPLTACSTFGSPKIVTVCFPEQMGKHISSGFSIL